MTELARDLGPAQMKERTGNVREAGNGEHHPERSGNIPRWLRMAESRSDTLN